MNHEALTERLSKIQIEKLSYISINYDGNEFELIDELRDKRYVVNKAVSEICKLIDGKNSLLDIAKEISNLYKVELNTIEEDIFEIYCFFKKNNLIICKDSFLYKYLKIYYRISFIR